MGNNLQIILLYHIYVNGNQYDSEVKSDRRLERFPFGKDEANTLNLEIGTTVEKVFGRLHRAQLWSCVPQKRRAVMRH